jgi:GNAT superfamily N-acetyltransferase
MIISNNEQRNNMADDGIVIKRIKVKELPQFTAEVLAQAVEGKFVPISMQRAVAHAHNPYADDEDIGLLVAVDEDDEIVGYFGILPLMLRNGEQFHKVHWFTTWSVSPKVRGRGVGSRLMTEALTIGYDYLIVGSVHARRVSREHGFWERPPLLYYWMDTTGMGRLNPLVWALRLYRKILKRLRITPRKPVRITNRTTAALDRVLSPLTKPFFYKLLTRNLEGDLDHVRIQETSQIHALPSPPKELPPVELHRGLEVVNWMLSYPWVVGEGESATEKMDYYFSDVRPSFRFIALEVFSISGEYLGFVVFNLTQKGRQVSLRVLDNVFTNPDDLRYVFALAIQYAAQANADIIEFPTGVAAFCKDSLMANILLQPKQRVYQCMPQDENSPLGQSWEQINFRIPDGDMAFS